MQNSLDLDIFDWKDIREIMKFRHFHKMKENMEITQFRYFCKKQTISTEASDWLWLFAKPWQHFCGLVEDRAWELKNGREHRFPCPIFHQSSPVRLSSKTAQSVSLRCTTEHWALSVFLIENLPQNTCFLVQFQESQNVSKNNFY